MRQKSGKILELLQNFADLSDSNTVSLRSGKVRQA
jgi:hypothetical protein